MNNGGASSSNPPPPPPPQEAASSLLAPGFRFHPTDEELVIYYLKRKVFGRPLRVEAIAEVDLYKAEPWDLPALSRLRSRDMEWYFFSPLDRKYANRSRTNRATLQGYWKTTGKDRPVHHGPRTVGMKKTLVFHVGRAPRGERTNWVMHEYRLEDEELARAGMPQDSFVVCRIFQKSGSGPQNGAQYGAPFVEDEWEEEADNMAIAVVDGGSDSDNMPLAPVVGGNATVASTGNGEYLQLSDFDNRDMNNEHEIGGLLAANSDEQNTGSCPEGDPIFLVDGISEDPIFVNNMNALGPLDAQTLDDIGGNTDVAVQTHSLPSQNDGYLELNDLRDNVNVDYPCTEGTVGCVLGECNGQMSHNCGNESNNIPERHGDEQFFDTVNESSDSPVMFPTFQDDFYLEPNEMNYIFGDYPSDHAAEDNLVFYDALNNDLPSRPDNFVQMDELNPPIAGSSGFYLVDDIMTYFDNTDINLHSSTLDLSEKIFVDSSASDQSNFAPEVGGSVPTYKAPSQALEADVVVSSVKLPGSSNLSNYINENVAGAPDSEGQKGCDGTFKKRLMNHLGSYSAPPALASDCPALLGKSFGQISSTNSASSVHVTAGMIQIHGFEVIGRAKHWSLHKNGDMGFLLSCGIASNVVSKSDCFEPITKMHSWSLSVVLRGGLFRFLLSGMFLALCFKAGMHAYCS